MKKTERPNLKIWFGDRVTPKVGADWYGEYGTMVVMNLSDNENRPIGVCFDKAHPARHDLCGNCDDNHGWWYSAEELNVVSRKEEKGTDASKPIRTIVIRITDDGAEAKYIKGKKIAKKVEIKRHPDEAPDDESAALYSIAKIFGYDLRKIDHGADEYIGNLSEAIGWIDGSIATLEKAKEKLAKI